MMYRLDLATIPDLYPRLRGDFNSDGVVDTADYVVWRKTLGSHSLIVADASRSGEVDAADYDLWLDNFGVHASQDEQIHLVPDPGNYTFLAFAALTMILTRHPSRRFGQV
jgi:hypothetical protein